MSKYVDLDNPKIHKMGRDKFGNVIYHIPPDITLADVCENKHGQWIEIKSNEFPYNNYVGCSVCKKEAKQIVVGGKLYLDKWYDEYDYFKSDYCPYCGADMRGEKDEFIN